jgi:hypothetical protein
VRLRLLWRVLGTGSGGDALKPAQAYAPLLERQPSGEQESAGSAEPPAPATTRTKAAPALAAPAVERPRVSAQERAIMVGVMRVAPDVRYRAARTLGLLDGLERHSGVELEHSLLERAHASGKLDALGEALVR